MRRISMLVLSIAAILGFATPAAAQGNVYPPRALVVTISDGTPDPGEAFEVAVNGCVSGEAFEFVFEGVASTVACNESSSPALNFAEAGASAGTASLTLHAPLEGGVYSGTVSFASTGAFLASFDINMLTVAPANVIIAKELADGNAWLPDVVTMLLLVVSGISGVLVTRLPFLRR